MKLTVSLLRMSNHLSLKHIPGDILTGKHRIWPKLNLKYKRHMLRNIETEISNMKCLARPFLSHSESKFVSEQIKREDSQQQENEKWEKIRSNKNKMQDQYMSTHFENLSKMRAWE